MKKRFLALIFAILLLPCLPVFAANVSFDEKAAQEFMDAWTKVDWVNESNLSYESDDGLYLCFHAGSEADHQCFAELLKGDDPPGSFFVFLIPEDRRISLFFSAADTDETFIQAAMYTENATYPAEISVVDEDNPHPGLFFDIDDATEFILSDYCSLSYVTENGVYSIPFSIDNWALYGSMMTMLMEYYYALPGQELYLDANLLPEEIAGNNTNATSAEPSWRSADESASSLDEALIETDSFSTDSDAIEKAAKSCFLLEVLDRYGDPIATGSAFVAFDSHILITNYHVIEDGVSFVAYSDNYAHKFKITKVLAKSKEKDIAILYFPNNTIAAPLPVSQKPVKRAEPVVAIGSPKGLLNTVSIGVVSNIVKENAISDYILFTASVSNGSSGGTVFNDQGEVIGISTMMMKDANDLNYAVPIHYVEEMYQQIRNQLP